MLKLHPNKDVNSEPNNELWLPSPIVELYTVIIFYLVRYNRLIVYENFPLLINNTIKINNHGATLHLLGTRQLYVEKKNSRSLSNLLWILLIVCHKFTTQKLYLSDFKLNCHILRV